MLVTGMMTMSLQTEAAETVVSGQNGVIYVLNADNYNFKSLWEKRTAPTRAGYVFGGWYKVGENNSFTAIKESEGNQYTEAYAKFVPAEVLSVRTQVDVDTEEGNGKTESAFVRLLSGVNGLDYQNVGFDIYYNKYDENHHETNEKATNITKVFSSLQNAESGTEPITANTIFGAAATHFSVLRLAEIVQKNYTYVIYVTPQWTTLDGTLVKGQGKFVRIMDGYAEHQYISVPVNFMSGSKVAAGQLELTYDSRLEVVEAVGFDEGFLMPQMSHRDDKNGTVKIVGNIDGTTPVEPETAIYANVWFKVKENANVDNTTLEFEMKNLKFANWDENFVTDLQAWDYKYLK